MPALLSALLWLPYLVAAWLAQPQADDFTYAIRAREMGWLDALVWYYTHWNGRLVANAGQLMQGCFGDLATACRWSCIGILITVTLGTACFLRATGMTRRPQDAWCAAMAMVGLWLSLCQPQGSLFWLPAAWNYGTAITFGSAALAAAHRGRPILAAISALLAGLCCESVWGPLAVLTLGCVLDERRRRASDPRPLMPWVALTAGLGAAAVTVLAAPGNAVRVAASGGWRPWWPSLLDAVASVGSQSLQVLSSPAIIGACGLLALIPIPPSPRWRAGGWMLLGLAGALASVLPARLALGSIEPHVRDFSMAVLLGCWSMAAIAFRGTGHAHPPSTRQMVLPAMTVGLAFLALGVDPSCCLACSLTIGLLSAPPPGRPLSIIYGLILMVGCGTWIIPDLLGPMPRWAAIWDRRREILTAAARSGADVVVLPVMPDDARPRTVFLELAPHPDRGENHDVARWYGVRRIWLDYPLPIDAPIRQRWHRAIREDADQHGLQRPVLPTPENQP